MCGSPAGARDGSSGFAQIYRLNEARLEHYDPALERQTPAFDAAQDELKKAVERLFADAEAELADLPDRARKAKVLRSLLRHREGLCVFVDRPQVPMDNNLAERALRGPVIGRRLSFGSNSEDGAEFTADHVLGGGHALDERHRCAALAEGMAECLREEWRQTARRPVALAAVVDERGAQARLHGAGMTGAVECRYYGRDFTADEMALLRALIAAEPQPTRAALSREFCRRIGWLKPDGGLKDMMAKVTMLAMHRDGAIVLPPPRGRQGRPKPIVFGPDTEPPLFPAPTTLDEVRPLDFRTVVRGTRAGKLWNEFVARYHYLGYKTLVGAQMRYAVHDRNGWPVAMLGFSTAAWKLAPRDSFIGWDAATAREEPPAGGGQPEVPHLAVDRNPQPRLAHPRHRAPPPARRLGRALQHHPRAH